MYKFSKTVTIISILVFATAIALVLVTIGIVFGQSEPSAEPWVLQSYGNNVALFNGEKVIEVYGSIMLDTLPDEDKRLLDNGIVFSTKEEAQNAIEDYDG
jgi:flagellar basal body-associated protein FliL